MRDRQYGASDRLETAVSGALSGVGGLQRPGILLQAACGPDAREIGPEPLLTPHRDDNTISAGGPFRLKAVP